MKMYLRKSIPLCILLLTILISGTVFAKGPPNKIIISHPDLPDKIEITDSATLDAFAMGQFVDFDDPIVEPDGMMDGYEIVRLYYIGETALKAIDKFVYYPDPKGENGVIYYDGIIDKMFIFGGSPYDGQWFRATESGDLVMQELLTKSVLFPNETNLFHSILAKESLAGIGYVSLLSVAGVVFYQVYRRKVAADRV